MKRMSDHAETARGFLELHTSETPLLLPNPWDLGAAKLLAWLSFKALRRRAVASRHHWAALMAT
jgi:2-methylisocitrate lyase-like PEP mutase family enzyme